MPQQFEIVGPSKQLAQDRPTGTSAASIWTPPFFGQYHIKLINITNTGTVSTNVSVYHDVDGTTYSTATALLYNAPLAVGATIQIEADICDYQNGGNLAVQSSVADSATFTVYGQVVDETVRPS